MLKEDQSNSYGTYASNSKQTSESFSSSDSSRFYLKCGLFACITITALILMAMYHSESTVSSSTNDNNNIIAPLHALTNSEPDETELIPYRINFHICDEEGAGHDPDDQEVHTYYVSVTSGRGHISDPQPIDAILEPDTYIGLTYNLPSTLGRDITSITFIANNNDPICIDSITITVDPFKSDGRGSVERAWITTDYTFDVENTCDAQADDQVLAKSTLKDRNLYFVGIGITNKALNDAELESSAIAVQLGGDNGWSDTFMIQLNDGNLDALNGDRYYIRQYESDINLGSKIKEIKVYAENIYIEQIIAASASNPGAVTIGHNDGDRDESWLISCFADETDDDAKMEYMAAHADELEALPSDNGRSRGRKKPMPKDRGMADDQRGQKEGKLLKGETAKNSGKVGAKGQQRRSANDL